MNIGLNFQIIYEGALQVRKQFDNKGSIISIVSAKKHTFELLLEAQNDWNKISNGVLLQYYLAANWTPRNLPPDPFLNDLKKEFKVYSFTSLNSIVSFPAIIDESVSDSKVIIRLWNYEFKKYI